VEKCKLSILAGVGLVAIALVAVMLLALAGGQRPVRAIAARRARHQRRWEHMVANLLDHLAIYLFAGMDRSLM